MYNAHWLVIANAQPLFEDFWHDYLDGRKVCVCDGAYVAVKESGIPVDVVIGDFDSIAVNDLKDLSVSSRVKTVKVVDQSYTDLEKAIRYIDQLRPKSIVIVNAFANRIDHSLYNFRLLARYHQPERELTIKTKDQQMLCLRDQSMTLSGKVGACVSVFGFSLSTLSSQGLYYDVTEHALGITGIDSVSNSMAANTATVSIQGRAVAVCDAEVDLSIDAYSRE